MRTQSMWVMCFALSIAVALHPGRSWAQSVDVAALIKLIENQPQGIDRSTWKEQRRDAARKLVQSKDKRAIPVLVKLAETETFDIIGEISIEGLGNLADPSAQSALQSIASDPARDAAQRDLARQALAKLGARADAAAPTDRNASDNKPPTGLETRVNGGEVRDADASTGRTSSSSTTATPRLLDDTLAAYDRLTIAAGAASAGYDTSRKRLEFEIDAAGRYQKRIERPAFAWGIDATAHVVAGLINPSGRAQTRGTVVNTTSEAEARFYTGRIYGVGRAAGALQVNYTADLDAMNANGDYRQTTSLADIGAAIGIGYGRVLDVGAAIRVRRLTRALEAARALGTAISAATSRKLQLTWWSLRGERSSYRSLVATVAILREAGVLVGEPDSGLTFEILNVLRDHQLFVRPSGFEVDLSFGESYLRRPQGLIDQGFENGRVEQLIGRASYGRQLVDDKLEVTGSAFGRLRLFAGDSGGNANPAPWAIGAQARAMRFAYGDHGESLGALELGATVQLSSDDRMGTNKALRIAGELGYAINLNESSGVRVAAEVADDNGTIVVGAHLKATYGLADGTFAN